LIHRVLETGSTNSDLLARLRAGDLIPEGDWLVADKQTEGRGRQARDWFDGAGNFMGSSVIRLQPGDPDAATLALVAGLALHEAVAWHAPAQADLLLKWPNDLLLENAKLAGILLEKAQDSVVLGIGVNLVFAPAIAGRKTAALSSFGTAPDRDAFAADLAKSFAAELQRWRQSGLAAIVRRWQALAHEIGTPMQVAQPGKAAVEGEYAGLTGDGALQLRLADGSMRAIQAGEVFLAGGGDA